MFWHCEHCGYEASVGLVADLRSGVAADCPVCHKVMTVEDPISSLSGHAPDEHVEGRQMATAR